MLTLLLLPLASGAKAQEANGPAFPVVASFAAEEAQQGVAVDRDFIYVIGNDVIGKYDRKSFRRVARFKDAPNGHLQHMNGGVVVGDRLYCSHSNFPDTPMTSSVEIFDTKTLRHVGSQAFGIDAGSLVWLDQYKGDWYVCFGHYNGKGGEAGMKNDRSVLVRYDREWRRKGAWTFPKALVDRWDGMTCSGGVIDRDGTIYATGHHAPELHVLRFPSAGAQLELTRVISSPVEGQGIALDMTGRQLIQMQRKERKIYVFALPRR